MKASTPILQAHQVAVAYPGGVRALDGVSLEVLPAEILALIGESGSGKTTLLRLFNRLQEPTSGAVRLAGRAVVDLDPVELRRGMGYVPQQGGLIPHWRVSRNVELVPRLLRWPPQRRRARAAEMLALVGLDPAHFGERFPSQLSGGQRQRVAFARALAGDPRVILLDEPFAALDALTRMDLRREFRRVQRQTGTAALLVTHDLAEALELADRVAVMREGRLLQTATPEALIAGPAPGYVQRLLALAGRGVDG